MPAPAWVSGAAFVSCHARRIFAGGRAERLYLRLRRALRAAAVTVVHAKGFGCRPDGYRERRVWGRKSRSRREGRVAEKGGELPFNQTR
jgi:hypothetical protein